MGEMTREEIIAALVAANPEAAKNIAAHGNLVAHPRTGAPIDNPYIKIKARAIAILNKIGRGLKTDALWGDVNR